MERKFDPILVEVVKNELAAITEEMAIAVWKTGRSAMVKTGDFVTAICDGQGGPTGLGYAAPLQIATFMELMPYVLKKWGGKLKPGDVILTNDPYAGMGHMPDTAIVTPIFWQGQLVAFNLAYSHHTDTGGRFPGGFSSQCTESFEEGVRLPVVKFYSEGKRNDALVETILANVRVPKEWLGDVEAKIAGCWRGEQEMRVLLDKHGLQTFTSCCDYLTEYAERETRAAIRSIADGRYVHEDIFEDDGFGSEGVALKLKLALEVKGDTLTVDFTGTAPQVKSAINCPLSMTRAVIYGALKGIVSPEVLLNNGFIRPIHLIVPEGSLLNPRFPAVVGGGAALFFRASDGLAGGQPGMPSKNVRDSATDRVELPRQTHMHLDVKPGDRITHVICGSGGHGDPWEREPEKVLADVKGEKVTIAGAREQYGVVIDPQSLRVDWERTTRLRQNRQELRRAVAAD